MPFTLRAETRALVGDDTAELMRLRAALDEIASGRLTGAEAIEAARKARVKV